MTPDRLNSPFSFAILVAFSGCRPLCRGALCGDGLNASIRSHTPLKFFRLRREGR